MSAAMRLGAAIPAVPEDVTPAWLTMALRSCGAIGRASVVARTVEMVEAQGAAAVVARIMPEYDCIEAAAPRSLVAKFASPYGPIRGLMHAFGGYTREVEFYRHFGERPGIPVPRCYHAAIDPGTGVFVLVMEDMAGARVADGFELSVADAETAVRHLAAFHATWWNHPKLRQLAFLRYPGSAEADAYLQMARGALASALPAARERFGSRFPASLDELATALVGDFDRLLGRRRSTQADAVTLVHGDFHPGQMFFPGDEGGRFAIYDWQTVGAGNGGDDLARIVCTGLTPAMRAAHDRRLIALYHQGLLAGGVGGFDAARCEEAFRQGIITSAVVDIIAAVNIDPALIEAAEEVAAIDMVEVMFARIAAAAEAHDVRAALDD